MVTDTTQRNSAAVSVPNGFGYTNATVTWRWTYTPNSDTNGNGRISNKDSCPCSWTLDQTLIMYTVKKTVDVLNGVNRQETVRAEAGVHIQSAGCTASCNQMQRARARRTAQH
jgi:hypothetical protein